MEGGHHVTIDGLMGGERIQHGFSEAPPISERGSELVAVLRGKDVVQLEEAGGVEILRRGKRGKIGPNDGVVRLSEGPEAFQCLPQRAKRLRQP